MSTIMSTKYPFPSHVSVQSFVTVKLSDKGMFDLWKTQMVYLIKSHGMLDFIHNGFSDSMDDDYELWKRSDALVCGWILGSLSEQAAIKLLSCLTSKFHRQTEFTAKDIWDQVEIMYGQKTDQQEKERSGGATIIDLNMRMKEVNERLKNEQQLYLAAESGSLEDLRRILNKTNVRITDSISINGNTVLHVAAANRKGDFLESMLLESNIPLMKVRNSDGSTLLHLAASHGNTDAAKVLVSKCRDLLPSKDNEGFTPLDIALSKPWNKEMCLYMWEHATPDIEQDTEFLGDEPLVNAISHQYFDLAHTLIQRYNSLKSAAVLMAIAQQYPTDFSVYQTFIYELWSTSIWHFVTRHTLDIKKDHYGYLKLLCFVLRAVSVFPFKMFIMICMKLPGLKNFERKGERRRVATQLLDCVCGLIKFSNDASSYPDFYTEPLLEAIRRDASDVVEKMLYWFPGAVMIVDEDGNNISQAAFKNRSSKVIALIVNRLMAKHTSLSQKIKDEHCENNFLHFVARLAPSKKLDLLSCPPFQLQRELLWFKVARHLAPQGHMKKNYFEETPEMVFTKEHKELVIESGKWMKSTANSYALTAALIITVVFAAAIQVPGGNSEEGGGVPNFLFKPAFLVFEASVAISMGTASLSLLLFLAILTSRKTEQDFLFSLPLALVIGLVSLFVSATSTMLAFGAALFLMFGSMYHNWILGLIVPLIGLPICFFYSFYFPLLSDIMRSAYQFFIIYGFRRFRLLGRIFI